MGAIVDEVSQARVSAWNYTFSWVPTRVVKCAVELRIPDVIEKHGSPISLSQLSSLVDCPSPSIFRIMRYLTFHGFFKKVLINDQVHYAENPLSRLFTRDNMAPIIMLHPSSTDGISAQALRNGEQIRPGFVNGSESEGMWVASDYVNPAFTEAMECHAKVTTTAIINNYPKGFDGVGSLVDVGGRHGLAVGMLVNAFQMIRGTNFDLHQVVSDAPPLNGVAHVGGSMFESVPKADAVLLMHVLHDWSDEASVKILKKCKEAIPSDTGKVMIVDAIIGEEDEFAGPRLGLDMVMMASMAEGKERTYEEWVSILDAAGFTKHKIINIGAIEYVIEAYP